MALPRLRQLDAYPVRVDGQDLICVRDLEGLLESPVLVTPQVFLIASMLDGSTEALDIQAEYARHTGGQLLFSWDLQQIVAELDRQGLLESEHWAARRHAIEEPFRVAPVRPAFHAGKSYPADPQAVATELDRHFRDVHPEEFAGLSVRGAIAPHIDLARGAWCYAWAHTALATAAPDVVVILGVAHGAPDSPLVLTTKAFATPLGTVAIDADLSGVLQRRVGGVLDHEIAHRSEHSIELQVLFLQRVLRDRPLSIVPILCSALERWAGERSPRGLDAVEGLVEVVRETIASGRRVAVLASVDFSHVGPRFGDREPADAALASRTSVGDRAVLEAIAHGDAEAFWAAAMAEGNPRRIDAVSATYLALRILDPCHGRLLRYGQAPDPAGGIVSFASVALS